MNQKQRIERVHNVVFFLKRLEASGSLTDPELKEAYEHLKEVTTFLKGMGDRYHFVWWDLYQAYLQLEQFIEARKRDGSWKP